MRCSILALTVALTTAATVDAQFFGRRRHRDCCAPAPTCCQPVAVQTGCCGPMAYGQYAPPYVTGGYAQAMPMPLTPGHHITPAAGTQPVTPAGGVDQQPQPTPSTQPPQQPAPSAGQPMPYAGQPGSPIVQGGECGCGATTAVAYADYGSRRRGIFRRR